MECAVLALARPLSRKAPVPTVSPNPDKDLPERIFIPDLRVPALTTPTRLLRAAQASVSLS
jgi:hypothetical protein